MSNIITVNGKEYTIIKLLGHGKGGYSYLAEKEDKLVVIKQIHHEPCDYFTFGNKIESELRDYGILLKAGIRIPLMFETDIENERIVKEYIEGETVFDLVKNGIPVEQYLLQVREMVELIRATGYNIDYFPTNFVVNDGLIWYVDYECSEYSDRWNFENWGIKYWSRTHEFEEYLTKKQ